ncbi:MAG: S41 family peptidase [Thermoanaerobaculia bacterium]|jgi:hypothetical protein|nr:S41 family peptidase [Thermoanaerobaculia bacterium]
MKVPLRLLMAALLAFPAAAGSIPPGRTLEAERVRRIVEAVAATVEREYVDPEVAARADVSLRTSLAAGRYASSLAGNDLAALLTRDLQAVSRDKHLTVPVPADGSAPAPPAKAEPDRERATTGRRANFGIRRVAILAGNVGYLDVRSFFRASESREAIGAAMRFLRNADALVVDLRENGGGAPDGVALLSSAFFDTPGLELFDIVSRTGTVVQAYRPERPLLADADGRHPDFLLTSRRTFSAGEGFAFLLQERGRARGRRRGDGGRGESRARVPRRRRLLGRRAERESPNRADGP